MNRARVRQFFSATESVAGMSFLRELHEVCSS